LAVWNKAVDIVKQKTGATNDQLWAFQKSFDMTKIAGLSAKDAMDLVAKELVAFIKVGNPAAETMTKIGTTTKTTTKAVTELAKELDYIKSKDILSALGSPEATTDMERFTEAAKQMHAAVTDIADKGQRGADFLPKFELPPVEEITAFQKNITGLKIAMLDLAHTVGGQLKDAFISFGASAAESIGRAIGAGEDVKAVFAKAITDFLIQVPKLVGMAMLNTAAGMGPNPAAIGLAVGGLALIGLSGLLSGIQQKQNAAKEADLSGISGGRMASGANGQDSPQGLAQAATNGQMGIIELNIDGQRIAQAMYGPLQTEGKKRVK
jgi:hypothetical protein